MLATIIDLLDCPVCRAAVGIADATVVCDRGHSFDIARAGYVSLLSGAAGKMSSDSAAMVAARDRVLTSGLYDPISDAVSDAAAGNVVLDVGAGTGHYLRRCLDASGPAALGVGIDLSKAGARAIARCGPRIGAVVADAWQPIPLRDGVATTILSVFAPRNVAEFARVLGPGGVLVIVSPTPRHLAEIVTPMGMIGVDPAKPERIGNSLAAAFTRIDRVAVEYVMTVGADTVADLVRMGPSAYHLTDHEITTRAAALPEQVPATCSVTVTAYQSART